METASKVLILGDGNTAGQREDALGIRLAQEGISVYFCPGNTGTKKIGETLPFHSSELDKIRQWALTNNLTLCIVGPEAQLERGAVDLFAATGIDIFGPTQTAAQIETDKAFAMHIAEKYNIPHPWYLEFTTMHEALAYLDSVHVEDIVLKANGLAGGKGVTLPNSKEEAILAINAVLGDHIPHNPDKKLIIQERLKGREVSILAFTDGKTCVVMPPTEDHKAVYDDDQGPNTGGMGAYAPVSYVNEETVQFIKENILQRAIDGMANEGFLFQGVIYAGLILTDEGLKVIEFNARFGDPEAQVILTLLDSPLLPILQACIHGTLHEIKDQISWKSGAAVCVVLATAGYPQNPDTITDTDIHGVEDIHDPNITIFHGGVRGRVRGVTAYGQDVETALSRAYDAISKIHFRGMHYRRDIGKRTI